MSPGAALSVDDPSVAGGAVPGGPAPAGRLLLGLVQRMMRTGMAMARCVNRIARQRMEGHDLSRMAPAGFDATLTNALVVQAVAWTAALRERVLALAGRPLRPLAPGLPKPDRAPRGRGATPWVTEVTFEVSADDHNDWPELAKPWRMGPTGVAVALRMIAGKSDREVVTRICDNLQRAAAQLGAEADIDRIAALAAAARALCPEVEAAVDGAAGSRGWAEGAAAVRAGGLGVDQARGDAPAKKPPD